MDNKEHKDWESLFDKEYSKDILFEGIFLKLSSLNNEVNKSYNTKVRHYYLKEHTLLVVKKLL